MMTQLYRDSFDRNLLLWGEAAQQRLASAHVLLCGLGGVGSYIAEALARSGVGELTLVDHDTVALSNLNRQLPALHSTLGQHKTTLLAQRVAKINPACRVHTLEAFITAENAAQLLPPADYYIDAIDHVPGKLAIIALAQQRGRPVAAAMGAARRVAPEQVRLADIAQSRGCPLARLMRRELKKIGITTGVTVVYSEEAARAPQLSSAEELAPGATQPLGSCVFVPAVAGLLLASAVARDLCGIERAGK